jgi:predicted RNA binding protein YcfA (HicA-like mRNA interferase family)
MKVRDLVKLIETDGWRHVRTRGSHRQYKHPIKKGVSPSLDIRATMCILIR